MKILDEDVMINGVALSLAATHDIHAPNKVQLSLGSINCGNWSPILTITGAEINRECLDRSKIFVKSHLVNLVQNLGIAHLPNRCESDEIYTGKIFTYCAMHLTSKYSEAISQYIEDKLSEHTYITSKKDFEE